MKGFHRRDFANRTGLAQAWTVKSADRLFTYWPKGARNKKRQLYHQISIGEMDEDTLFHHLPASTLECQQGTVLASSKMELEE